MWAADHSLLPALLPLGQSLRPLTGRGGGGGWHPRVSWMGEEGGWLIWRSWGSGVHPTLGWSRWGGGGWHPWLSWSGWEGMGVWHPQLSWSGWGVVWGGDTPVPRK